MGLEILATGLFASATGVPQYFEGKKAARKAERKQEHANRIEQASAQVRNATERRRAIARARMAAAQNTASVGGDLQSSSGLAGSNAGLATQTGANIGTQQQTLASQQASFDFRQGAQRALDRGQQRIGAWNAVGDTTKFAFSAFSGVPATPSFTGNLQGQQNPLLNNNAFISRS